MLKALGVDYSFSKHSLDIAGGCCRKIPRDFSQSSKGLFSISRFLLVDMVMLAFFPQANANFHHIKVMLEAWQRLDPHLVFFAFRFEGWVCI